MGDTGFLYGGEILRVDLSANTWHTEPSGPLVEEWLGGRGLASALLFRELDPATRVEDPENLLVFSAGPLVGTMAPAACRLAVGTKNALTGGLCASNAGGHFAPALKYAGFDAVVITGRAESPVYLWITDGACEIRDAAGLWGQGTGAAEDAIRREHGDPGIRVAGIGPAGENGLRGACLIVDRSRAAGRGGAGYAMGQKNLKALAVRGSGELRLADDGAFQAAAARCRQKIADSPTIQVYREGGSMRFAGAGGPDGTFPQAVRNYRNEYWPPEKSRKIYETTLKEDYEVRRMGCFHCPINCSHYYAVSEGPYAGDQGEGFHINTARAFGSNLDIDYAPFLIAAHNLCSEAGLDVDMAAACLAWAFEAWERGHLTEEDTGGLALVWGDHAAAMALLRQMIAREGFGATLADGPLAAARRLGRGSEAYAMHIKGAPLNEASMRPFKAWAMGIVLSTHGASHLDGSPLAGALRNREELCERLFGNPQPARAGEYHGQARVVSWYEAYKGVVDMLGICYFASMWLDALAISPEDLADLYSAGVGRRVEADELMETGSRLHALQKAFNTLHAGHGRAEDQPPVRLSEYRVEGGPFDGEYLDPVLWNEMLDEYYAEKGWDNTTGWQTRESLEKLGLGWVADTLEAAGRLK